MKIAIMQPYLFPYIGYFQLIEAVDHFVLYDDVNFIKRGWINRNQLLVNNESKLFSIPLKKVSQNRLINEIEVAVDEKWLNQFTSTLKQSYKKAPYFEVVYQLVEDVLNVKHNTIAELAEVSIKRISQYLDLNTQFHVSSHEFSTTKGMEKADRLIEITKELNGEVYINPSGGKELYTPDYFQGKGVTLKFIQNKLNPYQQFSSDFVAGLSIIDVLMFNSKEETVNMLLDYTLN